MRRLGQISVIGLAALAVWLAMPGADEPASVLREPSRSDARNAGLEAAEARSPTATTARLEGDPGVAAGPPRTTPGRGESRTARQAGSAEGRIDERSYGAARGAAAPRDDLALVAPRERARSDLAWVDPPERARSDTEQRFEVEALEPVRRATPHHRQDPSLPDSAPLDPHVERDAPEVSSAPEPFDTTGEEEWNRSLEQELLLDELARGSLPEDASPAEVRRRREMARTLLSAEGTEARERILQRIADQINAQR